MLRRGAADRDAAARQMDAGGRVRRAGAGQSVMCEEVNDEGHRA